MLTNTIDASNALVKDDRTDQATDWPGTANALVVTFQERLKEAVERSGLSERAFSEKAGLAPSHVNTMLTLKSPNPTKKTLRKIAAAAGVSVQWLSGDEEVPSAPRPTLVSDPLVESPPPPPISDTYASDDRIDALFEAASVPGVHTRGDERLVRQVFHRRNNLLREGTTPVDYVRKLLDTAAKCREVGRKVSPDELYDETFKIVVEELAQASRQLREATAIRDAMEARAQEEAKQLGIELRTDTPHPALLAGIATAKKKMERRQ